MVLLFMIKKEGGHWEENCTLPTSFSKINQQTHTDDLSFSYLAVNTAKNERKKKNQRLSTTTNDRFLHEVIYFSIYIFFNWNCYTFALQ